MLTTLTTSDSLEMMYIYTFLKFDFNFFHFSLHFLVSNRLQKSLRSYELLQHFLLSILKLIKIAVLRDRALTGSVLIHGTPCIKAKSLTPAILITFLLSIRKVSIVQRTTDEFKKLKPIFINIYLYIMSQLPDVVISNIIAFSRPVYPYINELKAVLVVFNQMTEVKVWGSFHRLWAHKSRLAIECRYLWLHKFHFNAEIHAGWGRRTRAGRLVSSRHFTKHQIQKCSWLEVFAQCPHGDVMHYYTKEFLRAY